MISHLVGEVAARVEQVSEKVELVAAKVERVANKMTEVTRDVSEVAQTAGTLQEVWSEFREGEQQGTVPGTAEKVPDENRKLDDQGPSRRPFSRKSPGTSADTGPST